MSYDFSVPGEYLILAEATLADRRAVVAELHKLKRAGHAIVVAETFESNLDRATGIIRISHYLSCEACARLLKEETGGQMDGIPK
jgi:hypothetical protein